MIRSYDFPREVPYRFGRRPGYYHVDFDDFGCLDDYDALYYADSLLNMVRQNFLALDGFDFVKKFDPHIFFSAVVDGKSISSYYDV